MRHVVETDSRTWETIQELVRQGRYRSTAQFIAVAIDNQLQIEENSLEQARVRSLSMDTLTAESPAHQATRPLLGAPTQEPILVKPAEEASNDIIWGLYNRIFPVKITIRVLTHLLLAKRDKSVDLKVLREESAVQARNIGKNLISAERTLGLGSGRRLSISLPVRRGDKPMERFKDMFVGAMSNQGKIGGFPATLRFVQLQRIDGRARVSLTSSGYEFAKLKNPILDGTPEVSGGTLSMAESDFYIKHIQLVLPKEWALCSKIVEKIPDGSDTPDAVDQIIKQIVPDLKASMVAPTRAGIISRLHELGFVQRRQDGLRVFYALTNRGESLLKSLQKVVADA